MIANLYQLKRHLNIPPDNTADDPRLLGAIDAASDHIERSTRRRFVPQVAGYPHIPLTGRHDEIIPRADLLELVSVTDAVGAVPLDDITTHTIDGLITRITHTGGAFFADEDGVTVRGVWGWHDHPERLWTPSGDSVTGGTLSASATTFTVTDADALMSDGQTPRFSVGMLLRLEDEFMRVTAVDNNTNTLTVERGSNGSTASDHTAGTPIERYRPPYDVLNAVLSLAAWLYRQPDGRTPDTIPAHITAAALNLRRVTVA